MLTTAEAAKYLNRSVPLIWYHVGKKHLIPDRRIGNNLMFNTESLDQFRAGPYYDADHPRGGIGRKTQAA